MITEQESKRIIIAALKIAIIESEKLNKCWDEIHKQLVLNRFRVVK